MRTLAGLSNRQKRDIEIYIRFSESCKVSTVVMCINFMLEFFGFVDFIRLMPGKKVLWCRHK